MSRMWIFSSVAILSLLFAVPSQAQNFCVGLCRTDCTIVTSDALATLNAAVGLNPEDCGTTTTTLPSATTTTTTTTTTLPSLEEACLESLCATNEVLEQNCELFLTTCLGAANEGSEDECAAGALWICNGGICGRDLCSEDETLAQACSVFMMDCLAAADSQADIEGCFGVGLFKCGDLF